MKELVDERLMKLKGERTRGVKRESYWKAGCLSCSMKGPRRRESEVGTGCLFREESYMN